MKATLLSFSVILLAVFGVRGQGTVITYQGRLNDGSLPANGVYDLKFSLYAANAGGVVTAGPLTNSSTAVSNGLFTALIDFGPGVFTGSSNWMEIGVRTNGAVPFNTLTPRQLLTPTPYAIFANTASNLSGTLPAAQLTGTISAASLSGTLALAQLPAAVLTNNESSAVTLNNTLTLPDPATIFSGSGTVLRSDFSHANFFAGAAAGNLTMTGSFNTGSGRFALLGNTSGSENTAFGGNALFLNTIGNFNTAGGASALSLNGSGNNNTAFGVLALGDNTTGNNNTAVGQAALQSTTGINNTALGYLAGSNLTVGSNNIDIGNQGVAGESGVIRIGDPGDQTNVFIAGTLNGDAGGLTNLNPSQFAFASGITVQQNPGTGGPNVIEGSQNNFVSGGVIGATISGGGATNLLAGTNSVTADFGTVGGGRQNAAASYGFVGGGWGNTASGSTATVSGGVGNLASGNYSAVGGGDGNIAQAFAATIAGGNGNTAGGQYSSVGGGAFNVATNFMSTIPGGESNLASGQFSFAAGRLGQATNTGAFVWADSQNALFSSTANDSFNVRAKGGVNFVTSGAGLTLDGQAVLGGNGLRVISSATDAPDVVNGAAVNVVDAGVQGSVIAGGGTTNFLGFDTYNRVSADFSSIGGGVANWIEPGAGESIIAGGDGNSISGSYSMIGGGKINESSGNYATVGGGYANRASGDYATVVGGFGGLATNTYSVVLGGQFNTAGGQSSLAAGHQAKAYHSGTFVWADSQTIDFPSSTNDQFLIRAQGGVGINTNNPGGASLYVKGNRTNGWQGSVGFFENSDTTTNAAPALRVFVDSGARTPDGALSVSANVTATTPNSLIAEFGNSSAFVMVITNDGTIYTSGDVFARGLKLTSDRNVKDNFAALDPRQVLGKVVSMPITEWNYKSDLAETKHIGPVAQDFHTAFGLNGADDKHISVVDEGGVALAAIQGLNQKLEDGSHKSEGRIQKLEIENAELRQRLARLEQLINAQQPISSSR